MNFTEKLKHSIASSGSTLCVGLDPVPERLPKPIRDEYTLKEKQVLEFCRRIIEATKNYACAFKPNTAFFEALGSKGWEILEEISEIVPSNRILIVDAKRGDIGNTAERYKTALFDTLNADAVTLNTLMGIETIDPYINEESKAIFLLTMTSNKGAADFLQRRFEGRMSLGEYMAEQFEKKQVKCATHLGMVIGATQSDWIKPVLKAHNRAHLLIPGVGKQGGSIEDMKSILESHSGIPIFNSSRSIIYAGGDSPDWIELVTKKAIKIKQSLQSITDSYA